MSHHSHHSVWPCAVTLLFLVSIVLCYLGLQEQSFRAVFRPNVYLGFILHVDQRRVFQKNKTSRQKAPEYGISCLVMAYIDDAAGAKPSPSVKPVIVFELIDLHSLLLVRRRHYQRHDRS